MYVRKTYDEYEVLGNYGYGWDVLTTCATLKEARDDLKAYRENEPSVPHKIEKRRVRIEK